MSDVFKAGDRVLVRWTDASGIEGIRRAVGHVLFGSANGRALIIEVEAIVHGFVGQVPVFQDEDGSWQTLTRRVIDLVAAAEDDLEWE